MLKIENLLTIDSTNNWCRSYQGELPVAVIAKVQTAGRGRYGKTFYSPAGGAYLSYAFRASYADDVQLLTIVAAAVVHQVLSGHCRNELGIKWVNDIYCGQRKIAGILCERIDATDGSGDYYIVVGVGVNVIACELPDELDDIVGFLCDDICESGASDDVCCGQVTPSELANELAIALDDVLGHCGDATQHSTSNDAMSSVANDYSQYIDYYKQHCYNIPADAVI